MPSCVEGSSRLARGLRLHAAPDCAPARLESWVGRAVPRCGRNKDDPLLATRLSSPTRARGALRLDKRATKCLPLDSPTRQQNNSGDIETSAVGILQPDLAVHRHQIRRDFFRLYDQPALHSCTQERQRLGFRARRASCTEMNRRRRSSYRGVKSSVVDGKALLLLNEPLRPSIKTTISLRTIGNSASPERLKLSGPAHTDLYGISIGVSTKKNGRSVSTTPIDAEVPRSSSSPRAASWTPHSSCVSRRRPLTAGAADLTAASLCRYTRSFACQRTRASNVAKLLEPPPLTAKTVRRVAAEAG